MNAESLSCAGCGAEIPIPDDLDALVATCPYCRREVELPNQDRRRAEIARRDEVRAATEKHREVETTKRRAVTWVVSGIVVVVLAIGAPVVYWVVRVLRSADRVMTVATSEVPGSARIDEMTNEALGKGCTRRFLGPTFEPGTVRAHFSLAASSCARFLSTTGTPEAAISLSLSSKADPTAVTASGREIDFLYCPKRPSNDHDLLVRDAENRMVGVAGVECPREFGSDDVSTGKARVVEVLKRRLAAGCREVLAPAKAYSVEQTITATLVRGACMQTILATGIPDNLLRVELGTPLGETIPTPDPALEIVFTHCAAAAGKYPGHFSAALGGPFSAATIVCPKGR